MMEGVERLSVGWCLTACCRHLSQGGIRMAMNLVGQNVVMEVQGNTLVITVDLSQSFGVSGSGKSTIIATTGGNVSVPGQEAVKVGLNVYCPVGRGR